MDNPLAQYFRRPALYLKLPSGGKYYPAGSIDLPENKEIPVLPMTAIDEITSRTPDALFNGTAVAELIKSCVPNIKDPWSVPTMDLDPILIAIRAATHGNEMEIISVCPKCQDDSKYGVNLVGLLNGLKSGNYDDTLILDSLTIKFSPLSYRKINEINLAQFEMTQAVRNLENITDDNEKIKQSKVTMNKLNEITISLMSESVESITTPTAVVTEKKYIIDYLNNCDKKTYDLIKNKAVNLRESSELKPLAVKCPSCSNEYEQQLTINVTDFFD